MSLDPGASRGGPAGGAVDGGGLARASSTRFYLAPGLLYASREPALVTTVLGSCVAVCLWDPMAGVGGMNHFLLPCGASRSPRFGDSAVPLLVEELVRLGARRGNLRARVFGGACVLEAFRADRLGDRNVEAARQRLATERVPILEEEVGGDHGRKVMFDVQAGSAWVRAIERQELRRR